MCALRGRQPGQPNVRAVLRHFVPNKGLHPLRRLRVYPSALCGGNSLPAQTISVAESENPISLTRPSTENVGGLFLSIIYQYRDFYSEELIDQIYKGQTKYMLFDRTGFADLVHKISGDTPFDFFAFIDKKWDMFVSEYMRTH